MTTHLDLAADAAPSLEQAARTSARTPLGAAAALALALGRLCAREGITLAEVAPVMHAAHDATLDPGRFDA